MTGFKGYTLIENIEEENLKTFLELLGIKTDGRLWVNKSLFESKHDHDEFNTCELSIGTLLFSIKSDPIDEEFSKMALCYFSILNKQKEEDEKLFFMVISACEKTKKIRYKFNEDSVFTYDVVNIVDYPSKIESLMRNTKN